MSLPETVSNAIKANLNGMVTAELTVIETKTEE
jgi:hypothetical protein